MRSSFCAKFLSAAGLLLAIPSGGQSLNVDFGEAASTPPPATYGAAGQAGHWNVLPALHGVQFNDLRDLDGSPTSIDLLQIGGFSLVLDDDPATSGADDLLLDDYLVTFSSGLESCVFLDQVEPGEYEVLIYAWMPIQPAVSSYTSVDQEPGFPHLTVGGAWPGGHAELVTYSRHRAIVGADGQLDFHSGIVPGADASLGAALNGFQIRRLSLFADGFESGDLLGWSTARP